MAKKTTTKKTTRVPKQKVEKPFADGTMSNSAFFGMIRSALRNKSRFYYSIRVARERARVPYTGINKKRKWMYKCEVCNGLYSDKETNIHHRLECGTLASFEDLPGFVERLFCSSDGLMCVCDSCHDKIHGKNQ